MHDESNIFELGCLIQLSISRWMGTKKINSKVVEDKMGQWVKGTKNLVDPNEISRINKIASLARKYLESHALPFPIKGLVFVSKDSIDKIDAKLTEFQEEFYERVSRFPYETLIERAEYVLKGLFDPKDYPSDINKKFKFEWKFLILTTPDKASLLSPELYAREKEKFLTTMEEAREMGIMALRTEFGGMVQHLCDKLTPDEDGKRKIFKNSSVEGFQSFLDNFKDRNAFDDSELESLVDKAHEIIGYYSGNDMRDNDGLANIILDEMSKVKNNFDENLTDVGREIDVN